MGTSRAALDESDGPWGDPAHHLGSEALAAGLAALAPPKDSGELALIIARGENGVRDTPSSARLTPEAGVPGDAWLRKQAHKVDAQIAVMCVGVARLLANGQPLTLFGDNLLVDLDLSTTNLPTGSRILLGEARLEVTPEPHNGCRKFHQRFGAEGLRFISSPAHCDLRMRGIYMKVLEAGDIAVGDRMTVESRAPFGATPDGAGDR